MTIKTPDDMLQDIKQLPWDKRLWLVAQVLQDMTTEKSSGVQFKPLRSLYGLWHGFSISDEEIHNARQEMWHRFSS